MISQGKTTPYTLMLPYTHIKIKSFLSTFYLLLVISGFSQTDINESKLQNDLISSNVKEFVLTSTKLDSVGRFLYSVYNTNPIQAKSLYRLYLERGKNESNDNIMLSAHYYLAEILAYQGDYAQAAIHGREMLTISRKLKDSYSEISACNLLGNINYQIRNYNDSLEEYLKALAIARKNKWRDLELQILSNVNNIRTRTNRNKEAIESYSQIINLLQTEEYKGISNYYRTYLSNIIGIGVCNYNLKNYNKALEHYQKGLELAQEIESHQQITIFHMNIGEVYTAMGVYDKAFQVLQELKKDLKSHKETTFNKHLHTTNYHLATVFYKTEEYQKALDCLSESFEIIDNAEKEGQVEKINQMYDLASRTAEKLNNKELQLKYVMAYRRVIDSFHLDDIRTKDQLYDQDINELEEKNQNLSSQNLMYIIISGIFIIIIIGLLIYNYDKQRKNKKLFEALQHKQQQNEIEPVQITKKEIVTDKKAATLLKRLNELEKTNFFLKQDCNLYNTAKLIDTNTTYLSKIINEHQQKSFNDYINSLRITYCMKQLEIDKKFRSYTIKAIASELGYKSVNTFASAFKKQTNLTHSYYINQILKKEKENTL